MIGDASPFATDDIAVVPSEPSDAPAPILAASLASTGYALLALAQTGSAPVPVSLIAAANVSAAGGVLPPLGLPVVRVDDAPEGAVAPEPRPEPMPVAVLPLVAPPVVAPVAATPVTLPITPAATAATSARSVFDEISLLDD